MIVKQPSSSHTRTFESCIRCNIGGFPNNVMLILLQNPYATRVAGYRAWQALDHQVMAKESALRILAPMTYKRDDAPEGENAREIAVSSWFPCSTSARPRARPCPTS